MFNLGFFELGLFAVIALIVLGPDKLPIAARTVGRWYGKIRRMSSRLQHELVSELDLLEMQQQFNAEITKLRESENQMKAQMTALQNHLNQAHTNAQHTTTELINSWQQPPENPTTKPVTHTKPLTNRFFLLSDYDKTRRLPNAPFLPNYRADNLLHAKSINQ